MQYVFDLETDYSGEVPPRDTILPDTSLAVEISGVVSSLDEIFDFRWRVSATDGHGIIEAFNRTGFFQMDIWRPPMKPRACLPGSACPSFRIRSTARLRSVFRSIKRNTLSGGPADQRAHCSG